MTTATLARRGRIYVLEARYQFLMVLREPAFAIPTLLFPLIFYLFFGVVMGGRGFSVAAPTYMLATYSVFGVLGPSLFGFGAGLATERDSGALLLKRTTPMPAAAYLLAKVGMALTFGAAVVLGIFFTGAYGAGVMLYRWQWFALAGVVLAGVIPFCALGLAVGAWSKSRAAVAITNLVFLPMAMLSGLWIPITMFPAALQDFANVLPAYHHAQLALKVIAMDGGQATALHVAVLAVQSIAFLVVAAVGFRRAESGAVSIRGGGMS
ncbi:MAG: ABC transporter permease [Gemmatimonadota bacterium]|uniref:ABC transporter permease n=1 Tax=Candidatus Palauibacter scopulicola TaxID=3056741 RepID=UPI0023972203|nr:ABC transporter permease [Candidatus Palauibacter scopulicola]MDE2664169.1 ABC transporter permease [Candidatus Palauibacter scopulicola]